MSDLISRQAAIDALDKRFDDVPMELTTEILQLRRDLRERIPSAQPATSCSEIPNGSDDTISRQAAIELAMQYCPDDDGSIERDGDIRELLDELENLPPAQPEQRWIPCSEKLPDHPENNDYYLVTIQCEHYDGWDDYVTGFAEWTKHGWDELSCYIGQIKVIAWMPLPEPYKEGEMT